MHVRDVSSSRWMFGYGSLIWRPAFEYAERAPAHVRGWQRRFHQGSTDHRGTPQAPGRVVTLEPDTAGVCWGMAYRVDEAIWAREVERLDVRESGGYERHRVELTFLDDGRSPARAEMYVAAAGNPNYLGPAPIEAIARQVAVSQGPSGHNVEYVLRLHEALVELGTPDDHVRQLADRVRALVTDDDR